MVAPVIVMAMVIVMVILLPDRIRPWPMDDTAKSFRMRP